MNGIFISIYKNDENSVYIEAHTNSNEVSFVSKNKNLIYLLIKTKIKILIKIVSKVFDIA